MARRILVAALNKTVASNPFLRNELRLAKNLRKIKRSFRQAQLQDGRCTLSRTPRRSQPSALFAEVGDNLVTGNGLYLAAFQIVIAAVEYFARLHNFG